MDAFRDESAFQEQIARLEQEKTELEEEVSALEEALWKAQELDEANLRAVKARLEEAKLEAEKVRVSANAAPDAHVRIGRLEEEKGVLLGEAERLRVRLRIATGKEGETALPTPEQKPKSAVKERKQRRSIRLDAERSFSPENARRPPYVEHLPEKGVTPEDRREERARRAWADYRTWRLILIGGLELGLTLPFFLHPLLPWDSPDLIFYTTVFLAVAFMGAIKVDRFLCPRCGNRFSPHGKVWGRKCRSCGLPKWSTSQ